PRRDARRPDERRRPPLQPVRRRNHTRRHHRPRLLRRPDDPLRRRRQHRGADLRPAARAPRPPIAPDRVEPARWPCCHGPVTITLLLWAWGAHAISAGQAPGEKESPTARGASSFQYMLDADTCLEPAEGLFAPAKPDPY